MFPSLLLRWYKKHARTLPWRGHHDAYAVWVSEIMLQQTRVEAVIPYFERWMDRFPSVRALAEASEQDVLNLWEGLGYYSRARNLHKAARVIMDEFGGQLPRSVEALRKLPGIGRYTAAAIASMAFGLDEPTLDGNIRRVYARIFNVDVPADSTAGEKLLWQIAAENLPRGKAGDYNQALMDLGAMVCLPKNPRCESCPLKIHCTAFQLGVQESRPILKPKAEIPHHINAAAILVGRIGNPPIHAVLLNQRPSRGLLGGMWEFPSGQIQIAPAKSLPKILKESYSLNIRVSEELMVVHHAYTHFRVTVHAFRCELLSKSKNEFLKWVKLSELDDYPMGKVDRQIAQKIKHQLESQSSTLGKSRVRK
ncbi:MAG: A/G-specific adenine glycosylase [Chloroflexi bacterium]|nr:A/G-specific adenine glycosylase [Chloroflexota bacterium]